MYTKKKAEPLLKDPAMQTHHVTMLNESRQGKPNARAWVSYIYSVSSTGPHVQKRFWSPKAVHKPLALSNFPEGKDGVGDIPSSTRVTVGQNFFSNNQGSGYAAVSRV